MEEIEKTTIDLKEILTVFWKRRFLIIAVSVVAAIYSVVSAVNMPNIYISTAKLAPLSESGGGVNGISRQLGSLASIAGIGGFGQSVVNKETIALETLSSFRFFKDYLYEDILVELMAFDRWDPSSGKNLFNDAVYDTTKDAWTFKRSDGSEGAEAVSKPTALQAYRVFSDHLNVQKMEITGVVSLSIEHQSPVIAQKWASKTVESINHFFQDYESTVAEKAIDFYLEEIEQTSLVSLREMFAGLIEEQTKTMMLTNVSDEYMFRVLEPAIVPDRKSKPNKARYCIIVTAMGFVLGVILAFSIEFYSDTRGRKT